MNVWKGRGSLEQCTFLNASLHVSVFSLHSLNLQLLFIFSISWNSVVLSASENDWFGQCVIMRHLYNCAYACMCTTHILPLPLCTTMLASWGRSGLVSCASPYFLYCAICALGSGSETGSGPTSAQVGVGYMDDIQLI